MIRRTLLVAAAALALILAPSVGAMAYNAPGYTCTVSDATPRVGAAVTVVCTGAVPGQVLTLTITGKPGAPRTVKATANASGVVTFTVHLAPAGAYTLVVKGATGALVSTQTVQVLGVSAAAALPAVAPAAGELSRTGFDGMPLAVGGGVLVLAGAGAVLVARRRKSAQVHA